MVVVLVRSQPPHVALKDRLMSRETWTTILRADCDGIIHAESILTLRELFENAYVIGLRMRFNPDMRLFTWHPPSGVTRERLFEAFGLLSDAERHALYLLKPHPVSDRTS
jgi:hypothetical protein